MTDMLHLPGVIDLFARQHWVAGVAQLGELGVSRQRVFDATRSGTVRRIMYGVVGIRGHCDTFEARCTVLHLVAPAGSYLSGRTAGRLHGLRRMATTQIDLTIPVRRTLDVPEWASVEHSSWPDEAPRPHRADGLSVASPLRTLFGLAAVLPERTFQQAAEDAWHRGLVEPRSAAAYLAAIRRSGRTGVTRFEAWLERAAAIDRPATTGLELLLVDLARDAGLPEPTRQHPLRLTNGIEIHLDLAWPNVRFAIEPGHSWWHGGDRQQREDQDRDRRCSEVGWHVVRFDESVWDHRAAAVAQIRSMYRARSRDIA